MGCNNLINKNDASTYNSNNRIWPYINYHPESLTHEKRYWHVMQKRT